MANDDDNPVNRSNKPVNGSTGKIGRIHARREEDVGSYTFGQDEIERQISSHAEKLKKIQSQYRSTTDSSEKAILQAKIQAQVERHEMAQEKLIEYEESHARKVNALAAQQIATYTKYDNVNTRTTTMAGSQKYYSQIHQDMRQGGNLLQIPTEVIEERVRRGQKEISKLGTELAGSTRGLGYDQWSDDMRAKAIRIEELQEAVAQDKRLKKIQVREGMTTEKRHYAAKDVLERAGDLLGKKQLEQDVSGGKYGSLSAETDKLQKMFEKLTAATERFERASTQATDAQGDLTQEYKEASAALDDIQKKTDMQRRVVGEVGRQGGGGIGGLLDRYAPYLEAAKAVSIVAKSTYEIAGNQDIQQMNNRAAFAGMGNTIYSNANRAIYGDSIDAAFDVATSDSLARAYANRNRKLRHGTGAVSSPIDIMVNTALGAAGGAVVGGGVGLGFAGLGAIPGAVVGGIAGGVAGFAGSAPTATNYMYGNEGASASIASWEAMKGLTAAGRQIATTQMQGYYNQGLNLYNTTMGMGQAGIGLQESLLNNGSQLGQLASAGVSASNAALLASSLRSAGTFSSAEGFNAILQSGYAAQRGQLNREEYMGMASAMIGAGGSTEQLGDIIAAATAKGMDNSKNITSMVSSTLQLSSGLASLGVAGTGAVGNMLSANVQGLVSMGVNENLAVGMATTGLSNYDRAISDTGFNLGNIVERQMLRSQPGFRQASVHQLNQLAIMKSGDHAVLRRGINGTEAEKKEAQLLLRRRGLTGLFNDSEGNLRPTSVNSLGRAALTGALLNVGSAGENMDILRRLEGGGTLSDQQRAILAQAGFDEVTARSAIDSANPEYKTRITQQRAGVTRDITQSTRQMSENLKGKDWAAQLGTGDAFTNLETLMTNVSEAIDPEKFGEITKEAAESFRVPVGDFGKHVSRFDSVITKLVDNQNRMLEAMGEKRGEDWHPSKPKQ